MDNNSSVLFTGRHNNQSRMPLFYCLPISIHKTYKTRSHMSNKEPCVVRTHFYVRALGAPCVLFGTQKSKIRNAPSGRHITIRNAPFSGFLSWCLPSAVTKRKRSKKRRKELQLKELKAQLVNLSHITYCG